MGKNKNFPNKSTQFSKENQPKKNGRPKKKINEILSDLKESGAENVTRQTIQDVYQVMLSLTQSQLKKLAVDESKQMIYRIIAKAILSKKGFEVIETMLDRANGKPKQVQDINQKTEILGDGFKFVLPEPDENIKQKFDNSQFDDD